MQVVVTGEPQTFAPSSDAGCHVLVGPWCGEDIGVLAATGYVVVTLGLAMLLAVVVSALARRVRRRDAESVRATTRA